ncbi:MAG TPA: sugar phosphate isomerase/epimerase family protein [Stellaceae bacterium]|nr:sugar phosphate isomerase/epimerase family protein [Stellaceae bacterium]
MRDLSRDNRFLSINTATLRRERPLAEVVPALAAAGVPGIGPWREQIQAIGIKAAAQLIGDHGLVVSGVSRAGVFTAQGRAGFQHVLDDNRRAIDEAAGIGAKCLVLIGGGLMPGSRDIADARALVAEGLAALLPHARSAGLPLAIEPLHPMYAADRACINTLAQANDLCDALGAGVGVVVDVYHTWWDPNLEREIVRAGAKRILAFHLSDWLVPTTDLLLDRGMMGDGVIDLKRIRSWVEAAGFDGFCEVEIFSQRDWWPRPMDDVIRTCIERYRTAC